MSTVRARDALVSALGPDASVEHRANHTGAGKLSFEIRVGGERLWAKVASDADEDEALATWARVAPLLADRHAAPPVLDVLTVAGRTTLLFPYLDAPPATRTTLHHHYAEAQALLTGLHDDGELAGLLGGPSTTAACFRAVWLERFESDLEVIEGYVARDVHAFLSDEVGLLAGLVDELDRPASSAVHGDPWHENFLVGPDRLWLLDWDDLAIGDPVVDDAILRRDALGTDPRHWPDEPAYSVARRALMLDTVVDVAADWVEAELLENGEPVVRQHKEAAYLAGLEVYRDEFSRVS